ncbi:MAG: hypothetical protein A3F12_07230 [Gammaproteobacteria bacterium RIFCSPHIGHO2_12_FULL_38_14]|nr:MAG: hypothetical protein A3F12_07230 [Gammaproteobacteria bacterium RIFCSPHIGHO2_12_FULL_38_14]
MISRNFLTNEKNADEQNPNNDGVEASSVLGELTEHHLTHKNNKNNRSITLTKPLKTRDDAIQVILKLKNENVSQRHIINIFFKIFSPEKHQKILIGEQYAEIHIDNIGGDEKSKISTGVKRLVPLVAGKNVIRYGCSYNGKMIMGFEFDDTFTKEKIKKFFIDLGFIPFSRKYLKDMENTTNLLALMVVREDVINALKEKLFETNPKNYNEMLKEYLSPSLIFEDLPDDLIHENEVEAENFNFDEMKNNTIKLTFVTLYTREDALNYLVTSRPKTHDIIFRMFFNIFEPEIHTISISDHHAEIRVKCKLKNVYSIELGVKIFFSFFIQRDDIRFSFFYDGSELKMRFEFKHVDIKQQFINCIKALNFVHFSRDYFSRNFGLQAILSLIMQDGDIVKALREKIFETHPDEFIHEKVDHYLSQPIHYKNISSVLSQKNKTDEIQVQHHVDSENMLVFRSVKKIKTRDAAIKYLKNLKSKNRVSSFNALLWFLTSCNHNLSIGDQCAEICANSTKNKIKNISTGVINFLVFIVGNHSRVKLSNTETSIRIRFEFNQATELEIENFILRIKFIGFATKRLKYEGKRIEELFSLMIEHPDVIQVLKEKIDMEYPDEDTRKRVNYYFPRSINSEHISSTSNQVNSTDNDEQELNQISSIDNAEQELTQVNLSDTHEQEFNPDPLIDYSSYENENPARMDDSADIPSIEDPSTSTDANPPTPAFGEDDIEYQLLHGESNDDFRNFIKDLGDDQFKELYEEIFQPDLTSAAYPEFSLPQNVSQGYNKTGLFTHQNNELSVNTILENDYNIEQDESNEQNEFISSPLLSFDDEIQDMESFMQQIPSKRPKYNPS